MKSGKTEEKVEFAVANSDTAVTLLSTELLAIFNRFNSAQGTEADKTRATEIISQFSHMERRRQTYPDLTDNPSLLKMREKLALLIKFSDAYIVDITFDYEDKLDTVNKISLRPSET